MPPSARLVRTRLTSGTVAALSVLLVAGCSSSHAHTASSTVAGTTPNSATTTPTTTPTTSSTSSGSATVAAALQRLVLRTGDLPAGWTGAAYQSSPGASNAHAAFSQCAGIPNSDSAKTGEVHSDDFSQGEATISSEAFGYSSAAAVTSDRSAIAGPKAKQCFQTLFDQQLRAALPAGSTLKPPSVTVYQGVPLTSRTSHYSGVLPDRITIYRRAICAICRSVDEVVDEVRRTVIHEVGHHFGIDDEELHELGW